LSTEADTRLTDGSSGSAATSFGLHGIGSGHAAASKQRQKQRQKKAIWQHTAAPLMEAQASGKSEDLHHATAQLRRALDAEGWGAWGCPHWPRGQGTTTGKICWAWYKL